MSLFGRKKKDKQKNLRSFNEINNDTVTEDFSVHEKRLVPTHIFSMRGFRYVSTFLPETLRVLNSKSRKTEK